MHFFFNLRPFLAILGYSTIGYFRLFYSRPLLVILRYFTRSFKAIFGYSTINYFMLFYRKQLLAILQYFTIGTSWLFYHKFF